jgi:hypothetical protein
MKTMIGMMCCAAVLLRAKDDEGGGGVLTELEFQNKVLTSQQKMAQINAELTTKVDNLQKETKDAFKDLDTLRAKTSDFETLTKALQRVELQMAREKRLAYGSAAERISNNAEMRASLNACVRNFTSLNGDLQGVAKSIIQRDAGENSGFGATLLVPQLMKEIYDSLATYGIWNTFGVRRMGTKITQIPWAGYEIDWASREPVASASTSTNKLTFTKAHGLLTGQSFTADTISPSGALPTPLAAATTYYAIVVDAYNIKVATTNGNAIAGTAITLTSVGTAEFDIVPTLLIEGMQSRDLIDVSTKVTWDEVRTSSNGILTRSIKEVETMVGFVPDAVALTVFLNALALQGTGAAVGQAMQMANLDIYGPNETPFIRVYGASLENAPARFGASADRVDKLKFVSNRTFQGNVQNPVIALGVAAPTV